MALNRVLLKQFVPFSLLPVYDLWILLTELANWYRYWQEISHDNEYTSPQMLYLNEEKRKPNLTSFSTKAKLIETKY